jgi:hypothetical protein
MVLQREKFGIATYVFCLKVERCKTDINDYHRQIEQHRDSLMTQHGGDTDLRSKLSEKNRDLNRYLDEIRVGKFTLQISLTSFAALEVI